MNILFSPNQHIVIAGMFVVGFFLGFIYDLLKIKRIVFGSCFLVLFIDDILFSFFSLFAFMLSAFVLNSGIVRWFELFCLIFGFVVYRLSISRLVIGLTNCLVRFIKRVIYVLLSPFIKLSRRAVVLIMPALYIVRRFLHKRLIFKYIRKIPSKRM